MKKRRLRLLLRKHQKHEADRRRRDAGHAQNHSVRDSAIPKLKSGSGGITTEYHPRKLKRIVTEELDGHGTQSGQSNVDSDDSDWDSPAQFVRRRLVRLVSSPSQICVRQKSSRTSRFIEKDIIDLSPSALDFRSQIWHYENTNRTDGDDCLSAKVLERVGHLQMGGAEFREGIEAWARKVVKAQKAWERGVIWQAKTIASNAELRE